MKFFICRPLKKVTTAGLCEKASGKPPEEIPEPCRECNPEEAQKNWRKYTPHEALGDELYQEFKTIWLEEDK